MTTSNDSAPVTPQVLASAPPLTFYGGLAGALAPFACFLSGVAVLALSGAPDEKGFWPILLGALILGLLLAKDRERYSDSTFSRVGASGNPGAVQGAEIPVRSDIHIGSNLQPTFFRPT